MVNSGSGQLLWVAAIFIGIALLAALGGSIFLITHWKTQIQNSLKQTRARIRTLQAKKQQLESLSSPYRIDDPEPIGAHTRALSGHLSTADTQIKSLNQAYIHQQEHFRRLSQQSWWQKVASIRYWQNLKKNTSGLLQKTSDLEAPLEEAQAIQQTLEMLGWKVALEARSLNLLLLTTEDLLQALHRKNLRGETLEKTQKQLVVTSVELGRIPQYFLDASQTSLLEQATKEDIALVFEILRENRSVIEETALKIQGWHTAVNNIADQLAIMNTILQTAESTLAGTPPELDTTASQKAFASIKQAGAELNRKATAVDTDNLETILKKIVLVTNTARDIDNHIRQAGADLATLQAQYDSLSEQITMLSTQFARAASRTAFPILWGEDLAKLTNTNRQIKALNPGLGRTTPDGIREKITAAKQIQSELNDLENTYRRVESRLLQLTTLIGSAEFMQMESWLENVPAQIAVLRNYASENFPRSEDVQTLSGEFDTLFQNIKQNELKETSTPVNESELNDKFDTAQGMLNQYQNFRKKFEAVWENFQELLVLEERSVEKLDEIRASLGQLQLIMQSNPTVENICSDEVRTYLEDAETLSEELGNYQQGTIRKKKAKTDALERSIETRGRKWTKQLQQIVGDQLHEISASLNAIRNIAIVSERAIDEGKDLIAGKPLKAAVQRSDDRGSSIRAMILEIKRLSDLSQRSAAILYALEDIKTPLMTTHTQALTARQRTSEMLLNLRDAVRKRQDWPPTSVSLSAEQIQFDNLEKEWHRLSSRQYNAVSLAARLGAFESRYNKLAERLNKAATLLREEAQQIEAIENRLDELESRWQDQWQFYSSNPFANQEIQDLLEQMLKMRKQIRRDYKRGERNFNDTVYALKRLNQEIKERKVMIDENQLVDIRGRIYPYRR